MPVCVKTHRGKRGLLGVLLCHLPKRGMLVVLFCHLAPYSCETESLTVPSTRLKASRSQRPPVTTSNNSWVPGISEATSSFLYGYQDQISDLHVCIANMLAHWVIAPALDTFVLGVLCLLEVFCLVVWLIGLVLGFCFEKQKKNYKSVKDKIIDFARGKIQYKSYKNWSQIEYVQE